MRYHGRRIQLIGLTSALILVRLRRKVSPTKRMASREVQLVLAGMAVTAAINAIDLLPNSSFTQLPFLYVGALTGYLQSLRNGWDKP